MSENAREFDPKGLILESFRMDGIGEAECCSIFLDWALSLGNEVDSKEAVKALLAIYDTPENAAHPMIPILRDGQVSPEITGRRGGRRTRVKSAP